MSKFNRETQKSVRVVMPLQMYEDLKARCIDYGDMSKVVRYCVRKWLKDPSNTIRSIYNAEDAEVAAAKVNGQ